MADKSGSGKKTDAAKKAAQAKSGKSARGRTIELTAEDVTPSEKTARKAGAPRSAPEKSTDPEPTGTPQGKTKPSKSRPNEAMATPSVQVVKRGGFGLFLLSSITGAALALGVGYGLLAFRVIALPDDNKAQVIKALGKLEGQVKGAGKLTEERLAAFEAKTQSKAQVYSDMLARANGDLAALKDQMTGVKAQVAGLDAAAKNNAKSLAAVNTAAQSALKQVETLALRLDEESKSRAKLGPSIAANTAQVQKRAAEIARLTGELGAVKTGTSRLASRVDDLFKGLKDIEKAVVEAGVQGGGAPSSAGVRISLLGNKFKRLEQDMAGLRNTLKSLPAVPPDVTPQIAVLEKSLARITRGIGDLGARDAAREDALRRLQDKTETLGHEIGKIASLDERLEGLSKKLDALQVDLGLVGKAADTLRVGEGGRSGALDALAGQIEAVRAELTGKIAKLEKLTAGIAEAESRLNAVDARLKDVKSVQAALAVQQKQAARVQSANRLQRVLLGGAPYKDALFAFMEVAPGIKIPESVNARASSGVLTMAQLRARFGALRETLEAQNILDGGSGLMGKIMKSAGSVVSVRRTGPTAGMSAGAIASRIADHLEKGNLALALKEAEGFKGDAREKAAPWIRQAQARLDAEKFAADLGALVYSDHEGE